MENEEYQDYETLVIPMEDGEDKECAILEVFECNGKQYIAVAPIENDELGEDTYVYNYMEDGDEIELTNIEDDDEFEMVAKAFDELMGQE